MWAGVLTWWGRGGEVRRKTRLCFPSSLVQIFRIQGCAHEMRSKATEVVMLHPQHLCFVQLAQEIAMMHPRGNAEDTKNVLLLTLCVIEQLCWP
jgi:hypothetical protein